MYCQEHAMNVYWHYELSDSKKWQVPSKTDKNRLWMSTTGYCIHNKQWNTLNYVSAHVPMRATHTVPSGLECISIIHKKHWHGRSFFTILTRWTLHQVLSCLNVYVVIACFYSLLPNFTYNTQHLPSIVITCVSSHCSMSYCRMYLPLDSVFGHTGGGTRNRAAGEAVKWMVTVHLNQQA